MVDRVRAPQSAASGTAEVLQTLVTGTSRPRLSTTTSSGSGIIGVTPSASTSRDLARQRKKIEQAVYSYIRARRALGHNEVNTLEISRALDVPLRAV
jgi:hypothetical protein